MYREANINEVLKGSRLSCARNIWRPEEIIGRVTNWKLNTKRSSGHPK